MTTNTLESRVRRALAKSGQALRKSVSTSERAECGDLYLVDLDINGIVAKHCDIDALAAELGIKA